MNPWFQWLPLGPGYFRLSFDGSASEREAGGCCGSDRARCSLDGLELWELNWMYQQQHEKVLADPRIRSTNYRVLHTIVVIVLGCKLQRSHMTSMSLPNHGRLAVGCGRCIFASRAPSLSSCVARAWCCSLLNFHQGRECLRISDVPKSSVQLNIR